MILDKQAEFSDAQAVTVTALSTNVYDLNPSAGLNTLRDIGSGHSPAYLVVQWGTQATAAGAATVTFTLESDSDSALSTSPTVHYTSAAIPKATLAPGYRIAFPLPSGDYERYLAVRYTIGTGPLTGGTVDAFIVADLETVNRYYASGITQGP